MIHQLIEFMFWAKSCQGGPVGGKGGGARAGVEESLVTLNVNIRERVLNVHPYLVCHVCTKPTKIYG